MSVCPKKVATRRFINQGHDINNSNNCYYSFRSAGVVERDEMKQHWLHLPTRLTTVDEWLSQKGEHYVENYHDIIAKYLWEEAGQYIEDVPTEALILISLEWFRGPHKGGEGGKGGD